MQKTRNMVDNRLTEILKSKKISKKDFAALVGTSPQYITGVCSGRLSLSIKQLSRFADVLGVPVADLLLSKHETNIFYCPHCGMPIRVFAEEQNEEGDEQ